MFLDLCGGRYRLYVDCRMVLVRRMAGMEQKVGFGIPLRLFGRLWHLSSAGALAHSTFGSTSVTLVLASLVTLPQQLVSDLHQGLYCYGS
jgi:hypothetical protein